MDSSILQRDHAVKRGRLAYTSKKPDRMDEERGREWWTSIKHADGKRSLTAHSEIDDQPSVLRYVQLNLDADWRPLDASVRLSVGDQFTGSGWYRFGDGYIECETFTAADGRLTQRMETPPTPYMFGAHAIQNDAWICSSFDLSRRDEIQTLPQLVSSTDHRGATGPTLASVTPVVEFVDEEQLSVIAGDFAAYHFRIGAVEGLPEKHPVYDLWTSADGDFIFLKGSVGGYMQTHYELVEYE